MNHISRQQFLKTCGAMAAGAALAATGCAGKTSPAAPTARSQPAEPSSGQTYLAVARGDDPAAITRAALSALGGMQRFVKSGQDVIIKPNICVAYHTPEYAATTNPQVVGALVSLCLEAGARQVRVMDRPFGGTAEAAYTISGISDAVQAAGGKMEVMSPVKYQRYPFTQGVDLQEGEIYSDIMNADVLINVPIAKHHSLARLTLGCKNLLGVVSNPGQYHRNLGQRIADLACTVRPTLTLVDAVRILTDHGPTGGNLEDVRQTNTVIASHDIITTDAYAATLFGLNGADIAYINAGARMGLGTPELEKVTIEEINL